MSSDEKYNIFIKDFIKTLNSFKKILAMDLSNKNDEEKEAIQNGQIQKFEICIEQAWKTAKWFLENKKGIVVTAPITALKTMFTEKIIPEDVYLPLYDMIKTRNYFSHIYKEEYFMTLVPGFPSYLPPLEFLLNAMQNYEA